MEQCFDVEIVNDTVNEPAEMFSISVRRQGSSDSPATTHITIMDDDGKLTLAKFDDIVSSAIVESSSALTVGFKQPTYTVMEQDRIVTVCVELNVVSSEDVTVILDDLEGTASRGSNVHPN